MLHKYLLVMNGAGRPQKALPVLERAIARIQAAESRLEPDDLRLLALLLLEKGNAYGMMNDPASALNAYAEGLKTGAALKVAAPEDADGDFTRAMLLRGCGDARLAQGKYGEALDALEAAIGIFEGLVEREPEYIPFRLHFTIALNHAADAFAKSGQPEKAETMRALADAAGQGSGELTPGLTIRGKSGPFQISR